MTAKHPLPTTSALRGSLTSQMVSIETRWLRIALMGGTTLVYAVGLVLLFPIYGAGLISLSLLPVVMAGWLFGLRRGVVAGLLTFPLNSLLITLAGGAGWELMLRGGLSGTVMLVVMGAVIGRLRDSEERVLRELHRREAAEAALRAAHDELEGRVRERTAALWEANERLTQEIEHRKQAEALLTEAHGELEARVVARTAELARSNQELQQFAYVASHDLQEPLRMISSYLTLLERRYTGQLDETAGEFIHFAVDGAKRMQALIADLLAYSRIGTRGQAFQATDCNGVVADVLHNLQIAITEQNAAVIVDPLPTVQGDATQLSQLFQNLIDNALKFRGEAAPQIQISAARQNGQWQFSVTDNGLGVDPAYAERIFLIFQRLHTQEAFPGTGIGLAICKRIVERHGGQIWVESAAGAGATFKFTLPADR